MSNTKYFYLYSITNTVTGSQYIGVHETFELDDGYMGSGKIITRAVAKYGKEIFRKEILEFFDSRDEMYSREGQVVTKEFIKTPGTMNIALGGSGGSMIDNQKPFRGPHTESTKQKISEAGKGRLLSPETVQKLKDNNFARSNPEAQRIHAVKAGKMRWSSSNTHSEETKKKISQSLVGKKKTKETLEKQRVSQRLRREREDFASCRKRWIYNNDLQRSRMIYILDELPEGWLEGRRMKFD